MPERRAAQEHGKGRSAESLARLAELGLSRPPPPGTASWSGGRITQAGQEKLERREAIEAAAQQQQQRAFTAPSDDDDAKKEEALGPLFYVQIAAVVGGVVVLGAWGVRAWRGRSKRKRKRRR